MLENCVVQKYGGATLSDPQKIKDVASRISALAKNGKKVVAVVSAMGKTTNDLIELAQKVSLNPQKRELDMLLSAGERISMTLLSMALNDLGVSAISFTGSQAGILTDDSHLNAFIEDVRPTRLLDELARRQVVILAGFQGVSPRTKDVTTLGRGGSDTTAVAMTAAIGADRCEILKDVSGVYTADPKIVSEATPISHLSYEQLLEMTFWGAKVLHYRSVELAKLREVKLYIGPAADQFENGTWVQSGKSMFESKQILSLNSHETVFEILAKKQNGAKCVQSLLKICTDKQIASPQILEITEGPEDAKLYLTGSSETMNSLKAALINHYELQLVRDNISTVTATCTGATDPDILNATLKQLNENHLEVFKTQISAMSISFYVPKHDRKKCLEQLHQLVANTREHTNG